MLPLLENTNLKFCLTKNQFEVTQNDPSQKQSENSFDFEAHPSVSLQSQLWSGTQIRKSSTLKTPGRAATLQDYNFEEVSTYRNQ